MDALRLDAPQCTPTFRGLQKIYLEGVVFDCGEYEEEVVDADWIAEILRGRLERGVPIQKLDFFSCPVLDKDHLYTMAGVVPDIMWDRVPFRRREITSDSEDSSEFSTGDDDDSGEEEDDSSKADSSGEDEDDHRDENDENDDSDEDKSDDEGGGQHEVTEDQEDEHDGSDNEETRYS